MASDNGFNLSARVLSEPEIKLLSRGLKFIPTPKSTDRYQLKLDLEEYGRRLKLKIHFNEVSEDFAEVPTFKPPSYWTPVVKDAHLSELSGRHIDEH